MSVSATNLAPLTERPSRAKTLSTWELCAAIVVISLSMGYLLHDVIHRTFESDKATGVPIDFPHYFAAGRLARMAPPENQLYFPPNDRKAQSYLDLRFDATTPYGNPAFAGGLPAKAITQPFDAPPFAALLLAPLTFLGWKSAYLLWQLGCTLLMLASVYLALRLFRDDSPPPILTAVFFASALVFNPFQGVLRTGNIDVVMLFLWVSGIFLFSRGKMSGSAFSLALGTMIKLSPVYAVPLFVLRRQWRWLAWYGLWCIALLGLSVWKLGRHNHLVWVTQVAPALSRGIKFWMNRSLAGFVLGFYSTRSGYMPQPVPQAWSMLNKVLAALVYCGFLFWCWKKYKGSRNLAFELTLMPLVVLLVSPISWVHYYVLAVLPLAVLWTYCRDQPEAYSTRVLALLTFSTVIIGIALPEYRLVHSPLPFSAAWVIATASLIGLGMKWSAGFGSESGFRREGIAAGAKDAVLVN